MAVFPKSTCTHGESVHTEGMRDSAENVPAYRTIRVAEPEEPVGVLADEEAWRAREAYPDIMGFRPLFGFAREREEGGWILHAHFSNDAPQGARESMGSHFRRLAKRRADEAAEAGREPDGDVRDELLEAAERLEWETLDELTVLGERYRVVRAEQFLRSGPEGPEPPRPSDPDPADPGRAHELPDPVAGFVIDPVIPTGMSEGILKAELLGFSHLEGAPADVSHDAAESSRTHPGGVLLPADFAVAEEVDGRWRSVQGNATTPQGARDALTMRLRVLDPVLKKLDDDRRAAYKRVADQLDEDQASELRLDGRHLRVIRMERLVRVGPDGPEGPRPSDPDPDLPIQLHDQRLREQGLLTDDDDDDDGGEKEGAGGGRGAGASNSPEFEARMEELHRLSQEEIARRSNGTVGRGRREKGQEDDRPDGPTPD